MLPAPTATALRQAATKPVGFIELWRNSSQRRFERDVLEGLSAASKRIPYPYLFDERGAQLAELILDTPEYYLSRAEREIVLRHEPKLIGTLAQGPCDVIDLAPEDCVRTRLLLERFRHSDVRYVPVAASEHTLREAVSNGARRLAWLPMFPLRADGHAAIAHIGAFDPSRTRLVLWLGSQIGQLERPAALQLLRGLREVLRPGDRLLVSFDLLKEAQRMEAAYCDAAGLNAELDSNILTRIDRELRGQFQLEHFARRVRFCTERQAVVCELISRRAHSVRVGHFRHEFRAGEPIEVRLACKYKSVELHGYAQRAGFTERAWFSDERASLKLGVWSVPPTAAARLG